jgi:hypothetical protein
MAENKIKVTEVKMPGDEFGTIPFKDVEVLNLVKQKK